MTHEEIDALSLCPPGVKLSSARTHLLEAGFVIKDQGKSDLSTDYHDDTLLSDGKMAKRVTVIEDDKGVLHFKVWEKKVFFEPSGGFGVGSAFVSPHAIVGSGIGWGFGPQCEHSFEQQRIYYQQYRVQYESEQRLICQGSDKK